MSLIEAERLAKKEALIQRQMRSFGLFVAAICTLLAFFVASTSRSQAILGGLAAYFLVGGVVFQPILRPVFNAWMKLAFALGWFNTRLLLGFLYFSLFTFMSLAQKLFGRDTLRLSRPGDKSLWVQRPEPVGGRKRYFRQF